MNIVKIKSYKFKFLVITTQEILFEFIDETHI